MFCFHLPANQINPLQAAPRQRRLDSDSKSEGDATHHDAWGPDIAAGIALGDTALGGFEFCSQ